MLKKKINKWLYEKSMRFMRKQAKVEAHTIKIDNYTISYLSSNILDKPTLIFIHGCDGSKDDWLMLAKELKGDYSFIMIDFLGCGESTRAFEFDYALASQALFLEKVIRKIIKEKKITQYSLCGTSSGASLAIFLANKLPINRLILLNSLGVQVKLSKIDLMAKQAGSVENLPWFNISNKHEMKEIIQISFFKAPYIPSFMFNHILEQLSTNKEMSTYKFGFFYDDSMHLKDNLIDDAKSVKQKTLIVWGEKDNNIDVASAYLLEKLIEHSTLKVYKECGHMIPLEKPKKLAKDIDIFLKN